MVKYKILSSGNLDELLDADFGAKGTPSRDKLDK